MYKNERDANTNGFQFPSERRIFAKKVSRGVNLFIVARIGLVVLAALAVGKMFY